MLRDPNLEQYVVGTALLRGLLTPTPEHFTVPILAAVAGVSCRRAGVVAVGRLLHLEGKLDAVGGAFGLYCMCLDGGTSVGYEYFTERLLLLTERRFAATVARRYLDALGGDEDKIPSLGELVEQVEACRQR